MRDQITIRSLENSSLVDWTISSDLIGYADALDAMETRVAAIHEGLAREQVWLLQHPPVYTAGTSADDRDLRDKDRFPVYRTGRGGQYTYHGPGQRIAYVMLDLKSRTQDVRAYVTALEAWTIASLARFGIAGERREDRIGVWVARPERGPGHEDKIAAIGIRVRHWVTFHGISINVDPDLEHFSGIVPCGIDGGADSNGDSVYGVTSLKDLGVDVKLGEVDAVLREEFERLFGNNP